MADYTSTAKTSSCLQDLLKQRSTSQPMRELGFYSLGNTSKPTSISYSTLYRLAQDNSKVLSSLESFHEGGPVLLHLHDHWDVILWFWSTLLANGLPVLSTPFSNAEEHRQRHIQGLSTLLGSPICVTRAENLPLFDGTGHTFRLQTIETLSSVAEDLGKTANGASCSPVNSGQDGIQNKRPAMLMLTSGSTGNAKAVVLTHHQILTSVAGKTAVRTLPPGRPYLNWIGLDHVGALVEIHIHALWANVDQVHVHAADIVSSPTTFLDLLSRHRVSRSFAPNFFLASLVSSAAVVAQPTWDLSDLTFLVSGGEANDIQTCTAASVLLEKHGARRGVITPGFGMTETCAGSIYNINCPHYDLANGYKVASLGKCINGMEMRVTLAQNGRDSQASPGFTPIIAQPGELGELEVRGDVIFQSYYQNPAATAEAFTPDGWFRTGDTAFLDLTGNLCLVGRVKEVINIHGVKVATADLQSSLQQAMQGRNIARLIVFASRAAHTEQVTVAYLERTVALSAKDMAEVEDLLVHACMMITASRPIVFSIGPESQRLLPTTTLGKVSRAKLQSLFEAGAFEADLARCRRIVTDFRLSRNLDIHRTGNQDAAVTEAEAELIDDFVSIRTSDGVDRTMVQVDTLLWELGYTSMDIVRLKHKIDVRLGVSVPIIMLMKNPTARLLAAATSHLRAVTDATDSISKRTEVGGDDDDSADNQYDPVIPFRTSGTKIPLWFVHPGVGEVLVFVGLAQQLSDDDRPLYALRARGFEPGETCFRSIDEAVDTYVAALRRVQVLGPYVLAGYSYGAMLAFEMAKKLDGLNSGSVQFLGCFNLPPHIKMRMRQLNWNMCLLHLAYFIGLTSEDEFECVQHEGLSESQGEENFRALARPTALARILRAADKRRMRELSLSETDLTRWADIAYGLQSMAVDYEPAGAIDSIHVFHAEPLKVVAASRDEWLRDHLSKWADFCRSEPSYSQVGGAHYTMLTPAHVDGFARVLKDALRARGV